MRIARDVRLAGHLISAVWALTLLSALLAGAPSPSGARGPVIAALGLAMGAVLVLRARTTATDPGPHVLAVAVGANTIAAAVALDAPWGVVAGTLTAAAAFTMGILSEREPAAAEPVTAAGRRAAPGAVHARLAAAVHADPDRTALLLADADVLRAVRARCGELEGEDLLREVAAELAAAAAPPAPAAPPEPAAASPAPAQV